MEVKPVLGYLATVGAAGNDGLGQTQFRQTRDRDSRLFPVDAFARIAEGDVDGDGRTDLVVIAHDRVLVYLQEK